MFTKSLKDFFKNPIITIPTVLFTIATQILLYFTLGNMSFDESIIANELADPSIAVAYLGKFMLFGLILMLFYLFISPFILSWTNIMCSEVVRGEKFSFSDAFKKSFKFYFRMLGTLVLTFLIVMGVYIIFIILLAIPLIPLAMSQTTSSSILPVALIVILAFVFLIAMIFLSICLIPIQPLLIYDDLSVIAAISRGFKFGFKKFFPILGVFLLLLIIGLVLTIQLGLISPIGSYIAAAVTSYLGIFTIIFTMNLYRDYKNKSNLQPIQPHSSITGMEYTTSELFDISQNNYDEDIVNTPLPDNKKKNGGEDEPNNKFTI